MIFKVLGRIFGRFFKGLGQALLGSFRWVARHEMLLGVIVVGVVVVTAIWLVLGALNINIVIGEPTPIVATNPITAATPLPYTPVAMPVSRTDAPVATENFMTGEVTGNADMLWNSLSANFHQKLAGLGRDKTYFDRSFKLQQQSGLIYNSYQYVAGTTDKDGTSIHFYVLTATKSDKTVDHIPWSFELDKDGKITNADFISKLEQ